jgi:ankyrin repeat protein
MPGSGGEVLGARMQAVLLREPRPWRSDTLLWGACTLGDAAEARLALAEGRVDPNQPKHGLRPLHFASYAGHVEVIEALLDAKASVEAPCEGRAYATPLYLAASAGHDAVVGLLLEARASPDGPAAGACTPLYVAAWGGHEATCRELVRTGSANVNFHTPDGSTVLLAAVAQGHAAVVGLLLRAHAEVDRPSRRNVTPLAVACESGHEAVVEVLLEHRADLALGDEDGWGALAIAAQEGHARIVKSLLAAGGDANQPTLQGGTPLIIAASNDHADVAGILLEGGADLAAKDLHGWDALRTAAYAGHGRVVAKLLGAGAQATHRALRAALCAGHEAVAVLLLAASSLHYLPLHRLPLALVKVAERLLPAAMRARMDRVHAGFARALTGVHAELHATFACAAPPTAGGFLAIFRALPAELQVAVAGRVAWNAAVAAVASQAQEYDRWWHAAGRGRQIFAVMSAFPVILCSARAPPPSEAHVAAYVRAFGGGPAVDERTPMPLKK